MNPREDRLKRKDILKLNFICTRILQKGREERRKEKGRERRREEERAGRPKEVFRLWGPTILTIADEL